MKNGNINFLVNNNNITNINMINDIKNIILQYIIFRNIFTIIQFK
jgi:hypothetical protein